MPHFGILHNFLAAVNLEGTWNEMLRPGVSRLVQKSFFLSFQKRFSVTLRKLYLFLQPRSILGWWKYKQKMKNAIKLAAWGWKIGEIVVLLCCSGSVHSANSHKAIYFIASARATRREGKINSRKLLTQKRGKIAKHIGMEGKFTFIWSPARIPSA